MKYSNLFVTGISALLVSGTCARGETKVVVAHNDEEHARGFRFPNVPAPSKADAATSATFTLVDGERDSNGGGLELLHDGQVSTEADQPAGNFFFNAGTDGGRILIDLGNPIDIKQVNTYSWHPGTRGPQVYKLWASAGSAEGFNSQPKLGVQPERCGWQFIAKVDTRPKDGEPGGQYGVSISDSEASLGKYRYLLMECQRTEETDLFGNTFYSEIDVVDRNAPAVAETPAAPEAPKPEVVEAEGGKYQITIDTAQTPDLTEWAHEHIVPMAREWYPKIVAMLPSEGYEAPVKLSISFKEMDGVAYTTGTRVSCAAKWFRANLKGEAVGAVFHELVHVVQQYGRARRVEGAIRPPGWLVEGLTDYVRWYLYEPQSHGAEISKRGLARAKYDGSYRVTANFLNWVSQKYDQGLVKKLNVAMREGKYNEDLWKQNTGHTVQELGDEWKAALEQKIAAETAAAATLNTCSDAEQASGWKLLFNGKDFTGWHNFKKEGVRAGWQVKDGSLVCADPHNAGDIVTTEKFTWFELQLDYNISEGGNSGIIYHVTDEGGAVWATGPEVQLEDNAKAADPQRCGWLYGLYQPPVDPKTSKPLDATKPAGEWNHMRLLISPQKCEHEVNGVKYFEYVLGSEDFTNRVARSKFGKMPRFAKSDTGYIALQGDHGQVSFRNIKIRSIAP